MFKGSLFELACTSLSPILDWQWPQVKDLCFQPTFVRFIQFYSRSLTGVYIRDMFEKKTTLNMAICRHYIMLHPERFPEPEMKKFGDKEVFYTWRFIR